MRTPLLDSGFKVDHFAEKPDFETASKYIQDSNYLWNSGIFVGKAKIIIDEFKKFKPEIANLVNKCINAFNGAPPNHIYQLNRKFIAKSKIYRLTMQSVTYEKSCSC